MPPKAAGSASASGSRAAKSSAAAAVAGGKGKGTAGSGTGGSATGLFLSRNNSRDKLSLCAHIIAEHFGPIAGRVASVLLTRGRLSVPDLMRLLGTADGSSSSAGTSGGGGTPLRNRKLDTGGISQRVVHSRLNASAYMLEGEGDAADAAGPSGTSGSNGGAAAGLSGPQHPLAAVSGPLRKRLQIQHALMVLVQHNVCFHVRLDSRGNMLNQSAGETADEEALAQGTEYFEMNANAILPRLRFGEYIGAAKDMYGALGKELVSLLLHHGKYQAAEIIAELGGQDHKKRREVELLLKQLLWSTYLLPSTLTSHVSRREREIAYERHLRDTVYRKEVDSPKLRRQIFADVTQKIEEEEREAVFGKSGETGVPRRGLKLKAGAKAGKAKQDSAKNGSTKHSSSDKKAHAKKKAKLSNADEDEDNVEDDWADGASIAPIISENLDNYELDDKAFLRVNYDRFDVHLRNEILVPSVADWYNGNHVVARVFRTILQIAEQDHPDVKCSDTDSGIFSVFSLESALPRNMNFSSVFDREALALEHGLKSNGKANGHAKKKRGRSSSASADEATSGATSNDENSDSSDDDDRKSRKRKRSSRSRSDTPELPSGMVLRELLRLFLNTADPLGHHKRILEQQAGPSLASTIPSAAQTCTFSVRYETICRRIKLELLASTIEEVFGTNHRKAFELLTLFGKLDEKNIQEQLLITVNDTRDICTTLLRHSIFQLQEIPRGSERTAQRTIFLYFVDVERAYGWLLDRQYREIENLIRKRLMVEAENWSIIQRVENRQQQQPDKKGDDIAQLLRDSEMIRWKDVEEDRHMLSMQSTQAERDAFILSALPG